MNTPTPKSNGLSAEQAEQARLKLLWEEEMKAVNKYVHHKHVFVLLLFWENKEGWTDMQTEEEVNQLGATLEKSYKFQVQKRMFHPDQHRVQSQMNKYLSDFIHEHDEQNDTLLIIYYAGHGWALPGGRGQLTLSPTTEPRLSKKEKERRTIDWNDSEHIIQKTDAEILLILDCCDSGTLTHHGRSRGRRFELLAACEHDKTTKLPGVDSFTSALIWALEELAPDGPFSTCKLRHKITESPNFCNNIGQTPVLCSRYPPSNRTSPVEHIFIEVLGQDTDKIREKEQAIRDEDQQGGDHVDFRYHLSGTFDEGELTTAAREMKDLMRDTELSLRRISFIRKGNSRNTLQQVAKTWRSITQRKSISRSPSPSLPIIRTVPPDQLEVPPFDAHNGDLSLSPSELTDVESPLAAANTERISERNLEMSMGYYFRGLLRCIWSEWFGWLRRITTVAAKYRTEKSAVLNTIGILMVLAIYYLLQPF